MERHRPDYPPTQCGLASFSAALTDHLHLSPGLWGIVRVLDNPDLCSTPDVVLHLFHDSTTSTTAAIETMNSFDAVTIQHEYGIYGGPDDRDVLDVVEA
jgi:polysaccharide biosynthesis protein PslF